jgi:hypothetical protein
MGCSGAFSRAKRAHYGQLRVVAALKTFIMDSYWL